MKNYTLSLLIVSFLACTAGKEAEQNTLVKTQAETVAVADAPKTEPTKIGMQALIEAYLKRSNTKITFVKKDFANGYAEFYFTENPIKPSTNCQFAYYTTQKDREILAVGVTSCMQTCGTSLLFYEMMNGELAENQDMIEGMQGGILELTNTINAHCKSKMTAEEKEMDAQGHMAIYSILIELPQQGTTIKINKQSAQTQKSQTVAQLQFNEKTGKFTFVKL